MTLIAWGVLLWFAAAVFIRYAPAWLFGRGTATMLLFALSAPVGWLTVWATRRVASLRAGQLVTGLALGSAAAMLCDGVALTWSPLYGPGERDLLPAAAWILWGVGVIILTAFIAARREDA